MTNSHRKTVTEAVNPANKKMYGSDSKSVSIIEKRPSFAIEPGMTGGVTGILWKDTVF